MPGFAQLAIAFCLLLAVYAAYIVLQGFRETSSFEKALSLLPRDIPESNTFDPRSQLGLLATEYIALFSLVASRNMLGAFKIEQASAPLHAYLRTLASTPRNIVGVLLMGALLVTLFNLQGSVATLGKSFTQLAREQATTTEGSAENEVKEIQLSMADIAKAAQAAFLRSGQVILGAAFILIFSLLLQKRSQKSTQSFAAWANAAYIEALTKRPMDQNAQLEKFGELIDKMTPMIDSFESIGASMATVGDFGAKLDASSQLVAQAVSQLPQAINSSVVQLSEEVTKDISVHLQHQIEHIKKILAIYGDQEVRVRKIQEYLDGFSRSLEVGLNATGALPQKLDILSQAILSTNRGSEKLAAAAKSLETKLDGLPLPEIQSAIADLRLVRKEIPEIIREAVEPSFKAFETKLASIETTELPRELRDFRKSVESTLSALNIKDMSTILTRLDELITDSERGKTSFFGRIFPR